MKLTAAIAAWPWVVATAKMVMSSMGALAYLVHCEWVARRSDGP